MAAVSPVTFIALALEVLDAVNVNSPTAPIDIDLGLVEPVHGIPCSYAITIHLEFVQVPPVVVATGMNGGNELSREMNASALTSDFNLNFRIEALYSVGDLIDGFIAVSP